MARNRTIIPSFPHMRELQHVSLEAQLFFVLLWTVADDAGRLKYNHIWLAERLYPFRTDALHQIGRWTDELVVVNLLERYTAQNAEYLRVVRWRELQPIHKPTPSKLPGAPRKRGAAPTPMESVQMPVESGSEAIPPEDFFVEEVGDPRPITTERVLSDLDAALRQSLASGKSTASARFIELAGRYTGLWGGRGAPVGRREPAAGDGAALAPGSPTVEAAAVPDLPDPVTANAHLAD
jgi:hypothetical protein